MAPAPSSDKWASSTPAFYGNTGPEAATFANKLESAVAAGLPLAVSQLYGIANGGKTLTPDQVLQYLQSAINDTANNKARVTGMPAPAGLPTSVDAAAEQVAGLIVASGVENALSAAVRTIGDPKNPGFAISQLKDYYESATGGVAEGFSNSRAIAPGSITYNYEEAHKVIPSVHHLNKYMLLMALFF
ncbi:hypothetical protein WJX74_011078 [Apatococcus lobatus]|uniref:Uncharacterized protein n=1 Tax=Apatococcus lobatus TaxID=904363 RepID=A0AAW1QBX4_9CHLO